jgi:hypothetical protein
MKPDPFSVWVSWEYTSISGGGICEGQEDCAYPNRDPEYKEHEVYGVFRGDDARGWSRYSDRVDVSFDPHNETEVFVVIVTYSSGSTFGSTYGNVSIVGIYNDSDEADAIANDIRADDRDADQDYRRSLKKTRKERFTGYKAWTGYFERFEGVEVHRFKLDEDHGVKRF